MRIDKRKVEKIVDLALEEDLGWGDVTTDTLIPPDLEGEAFILVHEKGILAGIEVAQMVWYRVDPNLKFEVKVQDGGKLKAGDTIACLQGCLASILKGERTALNFLGRLSGIASGTARYVEEISKFDCRLLDTRKTTPGLRALEKYAVTVGGGLNHRLNLSSGILIKDNHLRVLRSQGVSITEAISRAKRNSPAHLRVEVEVETAEEAMEAAEAKADAIMLDNMSPQDIEIAVKRINARSQIEASGGINLNTIKRIAQTGVDFISVGSITHSSRSLDLSLEIC
jgi:nicotinate-nucleotide pyrophosphorylase (carboxylating)